MPTVVYLLMMCVHDSSPCFPIKVYLDESKCEKVAAVMPITWKQFDFLCMARTIEQ